MRTIGKIDKSIFEKHFGKLQTDEVIATEDRIKHIKERHPEDYALFEQYGNKCIATPDEVITDERNIGTVYLIKKISDENINVVLRLALANDRLGLKNSVMTFWRIRDKNIKKLEYKNVVLYKNE